MRTLRKVDSEKAITLIALVVTIVILLILASVMIIMTKKFDSNDNLYVIKSNVMAKKYSGTWVIS